MHSCSDSEYKEVKQTKKLCIIVGHGKSASGGYDPGAISKDGKYEEFRIAREIAKKASEMLKAKGVDCTLMNYDGSLYLTDRIAKANAENYDLVAEIHLNAGGGTGTEVYYPAGSSVAKAVAQDVSKSIANALGIRNRGAKTKLNSAGKDYFAFNRTTKAPSILVETAFIDSSDLELVKDAAGQRKCAAALAESLARQVTVQKPFVVRIITQELNIREKPSTQSKIVGAVKKGEAFTIVQTDKTGRWGKLKSGAGWINLGDKYVQRVK